MNEVTGRHPFDTKEDALTSFFKTQMKERFEDIMKVTKIECLSGSSFKQGVSTQSTLNANNSMTNKIFLKIGCNLTAVND